MALGIFTQQDIIGIQQQISEVMTEETQLAIQETFQVLIQKASAALEQIYDFDARIQQVLDKNGVIRLHDTPDIKPDVIEDLNTTNLRIALQDLRGIGETVLKNAYKIIDEIRHIYTGQEIKYVVGRSYRGTLYERTFSLDKLLELVSITPQTRATIDNLYKLRFVKRGRATDEGWHQVEMPGGSTLWSQLSSYASTAEKKNYGNLYELYKLLYKNRGNSNAGTPALTKEEVSQGLSIVQKNTSSFVKGGDLDDESLKYFGRTLPSLASIYTIRDTLKQFIEIVNVASPNYMSIKNALDNLFIKDSELSKGIETALEEEAEQQYDKLTKDLIPKVKSPHVVRP